MCTPTGCSYDDPQAEDYIRDSIYKYESSKDEKKFEKDICHHFVLFGASGNLAKKKTYPSLWHLFKNGLLPTNTNIVGYSRTQLSVSDIEELSRPFITVNKEEEEELIRDFWKQNVYLQGSYDHKKDYENLNQYLLSIESCEHANRIFYLALPPNVFETVLSNIKASCMAPNGWTRVIIEKPFGRNLETFISLSNYVSSLFTEEEVYRIDHYLGKEMVQNLIILRFGNSLFSSSWNRHCIASVQIIFKETIGVEGRGEYFDNFGIIRDVMQNHLMQILSLTAMEPPASLNAEDIRDAKVTVLKYIKPLALNDVVIGQYVASAGKEGYLENDSVRNKNSITPTYCCAVLFVNNERWSGVPFVLRCGKALNQMEGEIRIQFQDVPGTILNLVNRNELVIRVQPDENVYVKVMSKTPGVAFRPEETELDLTYGSRYKGLKLPDAYVRLILDVFCGSQMHFVRKDELRESWRIFTPLLRELEQKNVKPLPYVHGSAGPPEVERFVKERGGYHSKGPLKRVKMMTPEKTEENPF